ncbi:MAG TPA: TetR/AcrR family transcriptional regulator [Candidatus Limnocylindrales bacterium]|nr:TetR/AcrR family transcriptional regulator [Candidatus Limnocylindrales bacterium]
MARTRNHEVHAVRRDAFVDAAARRITSAGYDALSLQDVIDDVGASKGAFYHYFGSKADLLEAIVDKMADGVEATWSEVLERPGLSARERLEGIFAHTAQYKNARRELALGILEGWLADGNAVLREKLRDLVARRLTPALERILRQGVEDGEFTTTDPEATARVAVGLVVSTQDVASRLFVARQRGEVSLDEVLRVFAAHEEALGRILGLAPGRLSLTDPPTIRMWFA